MRFREEAQPDEEKNKGEDNDEMIDEAEMAEEEDIDDKENVGVAAVDEDKQIIHSAVNENDWKLECQRVANKLKIQSKNDNKEWRSHIDTTKSCTELVKKKYIYLKVASPVQGASWKNSMMIFQGPWKKYPNQKG